jgi:hypothetical protein
MDVDNPEWLESISKDWAFIADAIVFELMEQKKPFDLEDFQRKARQANMPPRQILKYESQTIRQFEQAGYLEKTKDGWKKK